MFGDRERFEVEERDRVVRYVGPGEDFETGPNRFELNCNLSRASGSPLTPSRVQAPSQRWDLAAKDEYDILKT